MYGENPPGKRLQHNKGKQQNRNIAFHANNQCIIKERGEHGKTENGKEEKIKVDMDLKFYGYEKGLTIKQWANAITTALSTWCIPLLLAMKLMHQSPTKASMFWYHMNKSHANVCFKCVTSATRQWTMRKIIRVATRAPASTAGVYLFNQLKRVNPQRLLSVLYDRLFCCFVLIFLVNSFVFQKSQ